MLGPGQHVSVWSAAARCCGTRSSSFPDPSFLTAKQGQQSVVERPYTPISNADGSFELCVKASHHFLSLPANLRSCSDTTRVLRRAS